MQVIKFKNKEHMLNERDVIDLHNDVVYFDNDGDWYGLYVDGELVSILLIRHLKNRYGLNSLYTFPNHRGNGYMEYLVREVVRRYDKDIITYAQRTSFGLLNRIGFRVYKLSQFKNDTQFIMIKRSR